MYRYMLEPSKSSLSRSLRLNVLDSILPPYSATIANLSFSIPANFRVRPSVSRPLRNFLSFRIFIISLGSTCSPLYFISHISTVSSSCDTPSSGVVYVLQPSSKSVPKPAGSRKALRPSVPNVYTGFRRYR